MKEKNITETEQKVSPSEVNLTEKRNDTEPSDNIHTVEKDAKGLDAAKPYVKTGEANFSDSIPKLDLEGITAQETITDPVLNPEKVEEMEDLHK